MLLPDDPTRAQLFGERLALLDDRVAVAAPVQPADPAERRFVYTFLRAGNGWVREPDRLPAPLPPTTVNALVPVLSVGNELLVGLPAWPGDPPQEEVGVVSVFSATGATLLETQRVLARSAIAGERFGSVLAASPAGQLAVLRPGASGPEPFGEPNAGAIDVFDRNQLFGDGFE